MMQIKLEKLSQIYYTKGTYMNKQPNVSTTEAIILAAGKGSRLKMTDTNKTMLLVGGKPMLEYPILTMEKLGITQPIVVVGFARDSIETYFKDRVRYAIQEQPTGTATAVQTAFPLLRRTTEHVIVFYGDHSMFYTPQMITELLLEHQANQAGMTLVTTITDPTGFGRIIRDESGNLCEIVEEKNTTEEQKKIREINTGNGVYTKAFLDAHLSKIKKNELSGEYYFTDILEIGYKAGEKICGHIIKQDTIGIGVNTAEQLLKAQSAWEATT